LIAVIPQLGVILVVELINHVVLQLVAVVDYFVATLVVGLDFVVVVK
jgi:hypothetical protein